MMIELRTRETLLLLSFVAALAMPAPVASQAAANTPTSAYDIVRARQLYVSNRPEDHDPLRDHERDVRTKLVTDSIYAAEADGAYAFEKVSYLSSVGDLQIPAYLFKPLDAADPGSLPALVAVHGGVHGDWSTVYLPLVKEAVARGYVVIAPDYRGSIGYGADFHNAIDYGGYEVDDVISAVDFLRVNVPEVDPSRIAIIGWSHGGYIASLAVFRESHPFSAAVSIVPVSNLIFRLSYKGPAYQALFSTQARIGGLPHERRQVYVERSPVYHVDKLAVPMLVHVATNDDDVDFVEAEMFINALRAKKPELAETKVYEDPPGGHSFALLVGRDLSLVETPQLRDSWRRMWDFLGRNLSPTSATARAATN